MAKHWMQAVKARMERKGTTGSFGKATPAKIARGIKAGGKEEKRAVLARTFKRAAQRKSSRTSSRGGR